MTKLLVMAILVTGSWVSLAYAGEICLHYEPAVVELRGTIVLRTFFGPPNYGEDPEIDSRETQGLLELDRPICVARDPTNDANSEDERDQRIITLVPAPGMNFGNYAKLHVTIRGTLFHAQTGHHHTRVLMTVNSVRRTVNTRAKIGKVK